MALDFCSRGFRSVVFWVWGWWPAQASYFCSVESLGAWGVLGAHYTVSDERDTAGGTDQPPFAGVGTSTSSAGNTDPTRPPNSCKESGAVVLRCPTIGALPSAPNPEPADPTSRCYRRLSPVSTLQKKEPGHTSDLYQRRQGPGAFATPSCSGTSPKPSLD